MALRKPFRVYHDGIPEVIANDCKNKDLEEFVGLITNMCGSDEIKWAYRHSIYKTGSIDMARSIIRGAENFFSIGYHALERIGLFAEMIV